MEKITLKEKEVTLEDVLALIEVEKKTKVLDQEKINKSYQESKKLLNEDLAKLKFVKKLEVAEKIGVRYFEHSIYINAMFPKHISNRPLSISIDYGNEYGDYKKGCIKLNNYDIREQLIIGQNGYWSYKANSETLKIYIDIIKENEDLICEKLDEEIEKKWKERTQKVADLANRER